MFILKNINVKTKQIFKDIGLFEGYILGSNKKELFFFGKFVLFLQLYFWKCKFCQREPRWNTPES